MARDSFVATLCNYTDPPLLLLHCMAGIQRKASEGLQLVPEKTKIILQEPSEVALAKKLLKFPEVLQEVEVGLLPVLFFSGFRIQIHCKSPSTATYIHAFGCQMF